MVLGVVKYPSSLSLFSFSAWLQYAAFLRCCVKPREHLKLFLPQCGQTILLLSMLLLCFTIILLHCHKMRHLSWLVSSTLGLIAQMAGFLMCKQYKYACIFVDHFLDFRYVYMMKDQTANKALDAKLAFEAYSEAHGIEVKWYHADNGVFATQQWKEDCYQQRQLLTFAGVNAHHQNGKAKRRICTLQDLARCMLIHANHQWSLAISINLWPYALWEANDMLNHTNCVAHCYKSTPYQVFSCTRRWTTLTSTASHCSAQCTS
jgi:hypothetical protein